MNKIDIALGALETREMSSLTWGFVDQSLGEEEALEVISSALSQASLSDAPDDVLDELCGASLVRMLHLSGERRYRTRFAELLRLLARLRQWFPTQAWQSAATLVSDFRVDIRPRRYPRRHITPSSAWHVITSECRVTGLQNQIWTALTGADSRFTLSEFQTDAARQLVNARRGTATIVTAGTGSGKTLAFYLPALVAIAPTIGAMEWWTKAVCLYPRQELLKDQFSEAFALTLRSADTLRAEKRRPIVLGALFGPTPTSASEDRVNDAGWRRVGEAYVCPFLRCPNCGGDMLWSRSAINAQREVLSCPEGGCGFQADETYVRLTRRSLLERPADLLFTTTEMMNQRLSDTRYRLLFGIGQEEMRRPLFALVDEAHTYAGIPGAQTALLFRRWSALLGSRLCWAGLSATLPHAEQFFSDLTGVLSDRVSLVAPAQSEMISEGAEYSIVLRSDASSQVATLSASIQTVMLLARMLDADTGGSSEKRFGSKLFVFTDDLDVTNRLFDNLLDAEAYNRWRRVDNSRVPLAALRGSTRPEADAREAEGQCWGLAEDLRGNLAVRLRIGRTTSRDPGVAADSNVVVATSTLEVGFNDPNVGAVLQHKAPRSAASFLQRRGRAGRRRQTRPTTVVVLSDYGRDRIAFQSYESLFEPTVEIESLPVQNAYVLRIQAVYAIFEWIAAQAPRGTDGWAWAIFSGPEHGTRAPAFLEHARRSLQSLVRMEPNTIDSLRQHLKAALGVGDAVLDTILWRPPRAVLIEALPTLARRLFRGWRLATGEGLDLHTGSPPHPLPDFVPANLFSDLNLPEVWLSVPNQGGTTTETLPITQALQQFPPGRVQRRFADWQAKVSHWVPLALSVLSQDIQVGQYATRHEYLGQCDGLAVFRPWELQLTTVPLSVAESSNARWNWQSRFELIGRPTLVPLPKGAGIRGWVDQIDFRLHRFAAAASVWRFAHTGEAALRVNRQDQRISFRLVDGNQAPAAVGFTFEADAMVIPMRLPSPFELADLQVPTSIKGWWKYLAAAHELESHDALRSRTNAFRREWLHHVVLLAAIELAERTKAPLGQALRSLRTASGAGPFMKAIEAIVAGINTWPQGDDVDDGAGRPQIPPSTQLSATLAQELQDPATVTALIDVILKWEEPSHEDWGRWLRFLAEETAAQALHQACVAVGARNAAAEGLTVDIDRLSDALRVIVAETTLGGGGTIEALAELFASEPRALVRAVESACSPSDQEMAADGLEQIVRLLQSDPVLSTSLAQLREASDTDARERVRREMFRILGTRGLPVSRTLSVLLASRFVRPGATADTDRVTLSLVDAWNRIEETYGVGLPLRVAAAAVVLTTRMNDLTALSGPGGEIETAARLLWPRRGELRQRALQSYNPFRPSPLVDAALVRLIFFEDQRPMFSMNEGEWKKLAADALAAHGVARLLISPDDANWRAAVAQFLVEPVTSGFLQFYPMIEATRVVSQGRLALDLVLRDRI